LALIKEIKSMKGEMTSWRRHLHEHPELSGSEKETAVFLEKTLASFGFTTTRLGENGVVATLKGKTDTSGRAIILRADTDALPIIEDTGVPYASKTPGVMHACGHDGHMAMLLGAAKYLKAHPDFDGTVHFLFQPAEETGTGAAEMLGAGLLQKFPSDAIYGLHNAPTFPLGLMGTREGHMLSSATEFTITLSGKGGHVSHPEKSTDVLSAASRTILAVKEEYKKHVFPGDKAVLVVASVHTASDASNVLSDKITLKGTIRSFNDNSHKALKKFLEQTVRKEASKVSAKVDVQYSTYFPMINNSPAETKTAIAAARDVFNRVRVITKAPQTLGTEDFAYYLEKHPGNYMAMGTGKIFNTLGLGKVHILHSPKYDFNDAALPVGASYWVKLVQHALPSGQAPLSKPSAPQITP
jgi:amidohydrolase